jgi:NAD-dependent dihydropyrimidine dehydrogenase PreA subunit
LGTFIEISVDDLLYPSEVRDRLATVCPVDIFGVEHGRVVVRPEQEDECTLCELCLDVAPAGTLIIEKTYTTDRLISRTPRTEAPVTS